MYDLYLHSLASSETCHDMLPSMNTSAANTRVHELRLRLLADDDMLLLHCNVSKVLCMLENRVSPLKKVTYTRC